MDTRGRVVIWRVYNGWMGEIATHALVEAGDEAAAIKAASDAFKDEMDNERFYTPNEDWSAEVVELPEVY